MSVRFTRRTFLLYAFILVSAVASAQALARVKPARVVHDPRVLSHPNVTADMQSDDTPLVFSDSPETPGQAGVLYRDTIIGNARVIAYHANGLGVPARLLVLMRNVSGEHGLVQTHRRGAATTGLDPVIGQRTLLRYFASQPLAAQDLASGESRVLFATGVLRPDAVSSVMMDVHATHQTEVTVLIVPATEALVFARLHALPVLPRDARHQRGTFRGANRALTITLPDRTARLTLGGQGDAPLRGVDALTGDEQVLHGNYGVLYEVIVRGTAGRQLGFSTRGGRYRGMLGVVDGERRALRLIGQGQALKDPAVLPVLWRAQSDVLRLQFVPASGSNLPAALVFYAPMPHALARK